jgi:SanA protein
LIAVLVLGTAGVLSMMNLGILFGAQDHLYSDVEKVPYREVGVVLGCPPKVPGGQPNRFFLSRITAAAALFRAGKVSRLLLSGTATPYYDEPKAMYEALVERGVPPGALLLDPEGHRTIESIHRAIHVFGFAQFTIISQAFHNSRAVFLAQHFEADVVAFNAPAITGVRAWRVFIREYFARVKVFADLLLTHRGPPDSP